ncbi:MAG: hypothetical protein HOI95_10450 [Chromatiales bacterium]|nr:hypothetical protein [Chromatiales bacterium]
MNGPRCTPPLGTVVVLLLGGLLTGCGVTEATRQTLASYSAAMEEVDQAANTFLSDFEDRVKAQEELKRVEANKDNPPPAFPSTFEPPPTTVVKPTEEFDVALLSSKHGLQVIREYNHALVALAEGQSIGQVKTRLGRLGSSIKSMGAVLGVAVPAFTPFLGGGSTILKLVEDAQNRQQLIGALRQGRGSVDTILSTLEKQTPSVYQVSVVDTNRKRDALLFDSRHAGEVLANLMKSRSAPTDAALNQQTVALNEELRAALREMGLSDRVVNVRLPNPWPFTAGAPVYGAADNAKVKVFAGVIRTNRDDYKTLIARQNAYYDLLEKYVGSLRSTRSALTAAEESVHAPLDLRAKIAEVLGVASTLRTALAQFKNPAAPAL